MILYSFWRSTTSYRVRAALNLKGIPYTQRAINLTAGDQRAPDYTALNPSAGVPALQLDDGTILTQSLAIIDYLDAIHREPPMLSGDPAHRCKQLAVALAVATDIHPVNNLRVMAQLKSRFNATPEDATAWMQHWMTEGFTAIEAMLPDNDAFASGDAPAPFAFGDAPAPFAFGDAPASFAFGDAPASFAFGDAPASFAFGDAPASFAFGETPDLADLCIVAQAYNAHRWGLSLAPFPKIQRIEAACLAHPAIAAAAPEAQPDAPEPAS